VNLDDNDSGPNRRSSRVRLSTWKLVILIEVANVIFFALFFGGWKVAKRHPYRILHMPHHRNTTQIFTVDKSDLHLALNTEEANNYWLNITRDMRNGLVSLPTKITKKVGLEGSGMKTAPGETVFQIDMFHQLHCLQRIRTDLLNAPFMHILNPNRTSLDDAYGRHTLHCVDYLRQAVMCNGDLTLVSTGEDLEFDHSPPRKCRDFGAISDWVLEKKWEYERYTGMITLGGPWQGLSSPPEEEQSAEEV